MKRFTSLLSELVHDREDREDDGDQSIMEVPTIEMFRYLFMCVIQFTSDIDDQPNASVRNDAEAIQRMKKRFPG